MKESIFEMIAIEGCPKRIMNLFVVVAMSEKTSSETVHIVNDVMGKILLACDEVVVNEEAVDIKVSVLKASCGVAWAYDEPKPLQDFQWHGILFHAIAGGMSIDDIILSQVRELKNR